MYYTYEYNLTKQIALFFYQFRKLLVPGKIEKVLCLGNITDRSTIAYLNSLSDEFLAVKGEFDDPVIYLPNKNSSNNTAGQIPGGSNGGASGGNASTRPNNGQITVGSLSHSTLGAAGGSGAAAFNGSGSSYASNAPDGASLDNRGNAVNGREFSVDRANGEGRGNADRRASGSSGSRGTPVTLPLSRVVTLGNLRIGFNSGHTIIPNSDPDTLLIAARQLDVDIFLWGGTHRVEAYQLEGKFFVNPGSATGAFYTGWPDSEDFLEEEEDENADGEESESKTEKAEKAKSSDDENKKDGDEKSDDNKGESEEGQVVEPKDPIPSFCLFDIQESVCVVYIYRYIDGEVKVDKINYQKEYSGN